MFVGLGSAIAVVLGSMLPWATASVGPASVSLGQDDFGITVILGVAIAVLFLIWGRSSSNAWALLLSEAAAAVVLWLVVNDAYALADAVESNDLDDAFRTEIERLLSIHAGRGLFVTGTGGVGSLLASLAGF